VTESSLEYLAAQVSRMIDTWGTQNALNHRVTEVAAELWAELAELRDDLVDLDHKLGGVQQTTDWLASPLPRRAKP